MSLMPLNNAFMGEVIEHEGDSELADELRELAEKFVEAPGVSRSLAMAAGVSERQLVAAVESSKKQPFQVRVIAVGPDVRELEVGDIVVIPMYSGAMVTIVDEETQEYSRVFVSREDEALARLPAVEA